MRRLSRTPVLAAVAMLGSSVLTVSLLAAPADAGPRKTNVTAALSAPASNPGGVVTLSGRVKDKGKQKRKVVLEQKIASGWRTVGRTRSAKDGTYSLAVPTHWFYSTKLRARVKPSRKHRGDTSRARRMSVVPAYTPLGSPDSWETLGTSRDRWNPCKTLTYAINTSRATPDAATVSAGIHNTIALVSQATGVRFRFRGETTSIPLDRKWKRKDADIIFAWTTDAETTLDLGPSIAARGGYDRTRQARDARGKRIWEALDGGVIYDLTDTAIMNATQFQQLTLHEMGHVMGLGHVSVADQYMTPGAELYSLPLGYQAGDLNGLSKVGLQGGCVRPVRGHRKVALERTPLAVTSLD